MNPLILAAVIVIAMQPARLPEGGRAKKGRVALTENQTSVLNAQASGARESPPPSTVTQASAPDLGQNIRIQQHLVLLTGFLVVVGVLTAGVIGWQSYETRRAARAAKDAIQTQINAQRAWLLVDRGETPDRIQAPYLKPAGHPDVAPGKERLSHCIFHVKNYGKTPGKVTVCRSQLQIGNGLEAPPDTSVYEPPNSTSAVFFLPQDSSIPQEARLQPSASGFITWGDLHAIEDKTKFLWLCGLLQYEDVFSADGSPRQHETRFCYMWETRMNTPEPYWKLSGPAEYNRAT